MKAMERPTHRQVIQIWGADVSIEDSARPLWHKSARADLEDVEVAHASQHTTERVP